ncbi:MAG: hypothetical protein DI617_08965 [Streptococcus pyogenes]|nr:MAG: hypothetical protein DI617_08965 [Streptococcus pyogenes]
MDTRQNQRNLKLAHINLNHARSANTQLCEDIIAESLDVISVNEPYVFDNKVVGIPFHYCIIASNREPKAALILNKTLRALPILVEKDLVCAKIDTSSGQYIVFSVYSSPSDDIEAKLLHMEATVTKYKEEKILMFGDFNAKSAIWGPRRMDDRGAKLLQFINRHELDIENDADSLPTYSSTKGISWIDVLLTKNLDSQKIIRWRIDDRTTNSDHNIMLCELGNTSAKSSVGQRWRLHDLNWLDFKESISALPTKFPTVDIDCNNIEDTIESIEREIQSYCKAHKRKKEKNAAQHAVWWTKGLQIQRSKVRALRRRFQAETDSHERAHKKQQYKRELAVYRRAILKEKKSNFREYLQNIAVKNAFDCHYKIAKDKYQRADFSTPVLKEDGTLTDSALETEKTILRYHFPVVQDVVQRDNPTPQIMHNITQFEVEAALKDMNNAKAPGHNGTP